MTRKFSPLSDDDDNEDDFGNENDTQHQLRTHEDISCIQNVSRFNLRTTKIQIFLLFD